VFPAYAVAQQPGGVTTWDDVDGITYSHDSDNKVCRAHTSYTQIISDESQGGANSATLYGVWSEVTTNRAGIGSDASDNAGGSNPLVKVTVKYGCRVRSTVSTDLKDVYETIVRPHMVALATSMTGVSQVSAVAEEPGLQPQSNRIFARLVFLAPGDSSLIRVDTSVAKVEKNPFTLVPVLDGDPYSRDMHNRPGYRGAVVVATALVLGNTLRGGAGSTPFLLWRKHIERLEKEGYLVTELHQPTEKVFEFTGMGISSPMQLTAVSRVAHLEFAKIRASSRGSRAGGLKSSAIVRDTAGLHQMLKEG